MKKLVVYDLVWLCISLPFLADPKIIRATCFRCWWRNKQQTFWRHLLGVRMGSPTKMTLKKEHKYVFVRSTDDDECCTNILSCSCSDSKSPDCAQKAERTPTSNTLLQVITSRNGGHCCVGFENPNWMSISNYLKTMCLT